MKAQINALFASHFEPLVRFGAVGGITAAIYFSVTWVANSRLGLDYILAVSVAYLCSTTFHFLANRHFTFNAVGEAHRRQLARYLVMWALNYLITIGVVHFCVNVLLLSPYIGLCASIALTMLSGYLISSYWVFRGGGEK